METGEDKNFEFAPKVFALTNHEELGNLHIGSRLDLVSKDGRVSVSVMVMSITDNPDGSKNIKTGDLDHPNEYYDFNLDSNTGDFIQE